MSLQRLAAARNSRAAFFWFCSASLYSPLLISHEVCAEIERWERSRIR